jgi:polyhydroxybutyrate depolymerase
MCRRRGCRLIAIAAAVLAVVLVLVVIRAVSPSGACRRPAQGPPRPGTSVRSIVSGGLARCYRLYVPPGYDPSRPVPLVFSFHGLAERPEIQQRISGWDEIAAREGFVVVYPQGTGTPLRWNATAMFDAEAVDDVLFFRDMVAELSGLLSIDPQRIYVNGLSNGGAMTYRLACDTADLVAAVGTVAAPVSELPGGCTPSRPVPLVAFHGTADPVVDYEGRSRVAPRWATLIGLRPGHIEYQPAPVWTRNWAQRNGCNLDPAQLPASGDASGLHYGQCRAGADVIFYTIDGGGHTWPGGVPIPIVGKTSADMDASSTMWAFFASHPHPALPE